MVASVGGRLIWMGFDEGNIWDHFSDVSWFLAKMSLRAFPTRAYEAKK